METTIYESREEWLAARKGKITGSRLKDIASKKAGGKKLGYYELIAERLAAEEEGDEAPMDRGTRLEGEAMARFVTETGKKVNTDLVIWSREDNASIAISPDGFVRGEGRFDGDEAVEVKCLASARHIEAYLTQKIPSEYEMQVLQYFIVNDALKKVSVVFYDPRIACKDYFVIEVSREDVAEDIETYLQFEKDTIAEVNEIVNQLTF